MLTDDNSGWGGKAQQSTNTINTMLTIKHSFFLGAVDLLCAITGWAHKWWSVRCMCTYVRRRYSKSQAIVYRHLNTKSCQPSLLPTHSLSTTHTCIYIDALAYTAYVCVPLLFMNKLKPTHYIALRCHIYTFNWIIDANDKRRPPTANLTIQLHTYT